jgi:ribosomal protein S18 acetylase RimI-like enzyme
MSASTYTIRVATSLDIPLIRTLCFGIWPQTYASIISQAQIDFMLDKMYSPQSLQQQMEEGAVFLILERETIPVGFASYQSLHATSFKLHKLYVLGTEQGKGGGRTLIDYIKLNIQQQGAQYLELQVNRNNKAVTFYQRLGFYIRETADFDIGHGFFMNDYIMQIDLV